MSLVAYDYGSSDEEENSADEEETTTARAAVVPTNQNSKDVPNEKIVRSMNGHISDDEDMPENQSKGSLNGHISDDEDDFTGKDLELEDLKKLDSMPSISLLLPKPKNISEDNKSSTEDDIALTFSKLPMPKNTEKVKAIIEEEDDEFLRKKPEPEKMALDKPSASNQLPKGPVKISIPSLKEFSDVDKDLQNKTKNNLLKDSKKIRGSGLLSILPQAKSEINFAKTQEKTEDLMGPSPSPKEAPEKPLEKPSVKFSSNSLIPDTVKNRRPAYNTEGVDGIKSFNKKSLAPQMKPSPTPKDPAKKVPKAVESDHSDDEHSGDFFSLNSDFQLPEVSHNEISTLIAKKAAKMADAKNKFLAASKETEEKEAAAMAEQEEELRQAQKRYHAQKLNEEAVQALVGGQAKRRKKQVEEIQIMDISSDQVLPDKNEWMRSALASATEYQATGVLVDEEPASGTRRKHQITYLAHKAKANEAELQAMWAANRQNRRATQSKYGF